MPFIHSKLSKFFLDNAAGALQDISTYTDSVSMSYSLEEAETTTFGQTFRQFIPGFAEAEIDISGKWDRTFHTQMSALVDAFRAGTIASVTFQYGPEGNDAGDARMSGEAILTEWNPESAIDDPLVWSAKLRPTGTITHDTY